jgi:hypothetical protein
VVAAFAVVVGAVSDELENLIVIGNVARRETLSDGWIDLMRVAGTVKWIAAPAILMLYVLLVRAAFNARARTRRSSC